MFSVKCSVGKLLGVSTLLFLGGQTLAQTYGGEPNEIVVQRRPVTLAQAQLAPAPQVQTVQARPIDPNSIDPKKVAASKAKKKPVSPIPAVNLINALVEKGALTEEQGAELIKQAEDEAYVAREAVKNAAEKADSAQSAADKAADAVPAKGTRRVAYVPDVVKQQITQDVQAAVFVKAEKEGWAAPNALPEWTKHVRIFGDVRVRAEGDLYPKGNCITCIYNLNAVNSGSAFDLNPATGVPFPTYNVDQDRDRVRLRARLGVEADVLDNFFVGIRIGTGSDAQPVSLNQTLGGTTSTSAGTYFGDFSKYSIWLDQAYIAYRVNESYKDGTGRLLEVYAGRFENPFFRTDMLWDPNINFDGAAVRGAYPVADTGITVFANGGAFPTFNTALDFPNNNATKYPSEDRYLFAGQAGLQTPVGNAAKLTLASAFYDFYNIQGKAQNCDISVVLVVGSCPSDAYRPGWAQKGNTYITLRNIPANSISTSDPQYFGLASDFKVANATARLDVAEFAPYHIILDGDYALNTAFNRRYLESLPTNCGQTSGGCAVGPAYVGTSTPHYVGGGTAYLLKATVGQPVLKEFGDWNASVSYRHVESDATVDAFTWSDFGLGGTNLQGYTVGVQFGLGQNVYTEVKWLSADNIAGGPYHVDVVQLDLNAKF